MKILLDECMPMVVLDYLKEKKYDVVHVKHTEWEGLSNSELYKVAQGRFQIFITTDRHFTHPEKFKPSASFGVVYLRVVPTVGSLLVQALDRFLEREKFEAAIGKLVVVRKNDFSIR
ncbi:MAG: DUF5615 family PIN-like protein [Deltaproteobacteria bacterium]|nr:DUF5615 family PIN-like protein [Deltaproteobacteria bacterium]